MKVLFALLVVMLLFTVLPIEAHAQQIPYQIYSAVGERLSIDDIGRLSTTYDVLVFGEYHDDRTLHQIEAQLLASAYAYNRNLAISLEMFEKDVQTVVNDYLAGTIDETTFLHDAKAWQNYNEAYRPLIEFAKNKSLDVIAANIPRPIADHYAQKGNLDAIPHEMQVYLPKEHLILPGEYEQRFLDQMAANAQQGKMNISHKNMHNYYKAQCLKDDAMAESIVESKQIHSFKTVIHYNGDFHSRYSLGVAEKIRLINPELKIAVITPIYVENLSELPEMIAQYQKDGDILIFLQKQEKGL